jgi:hypothetical protein
VKHNRRLGAAAASVLLASSAVQAQSLLTPPSEKSPWSVGFYVGALSQQRFIDIPTQPWTVRLESSFLAALNVTYVVEEFSAVPLSVEIDAAFGKRFGDDREWDVGILPMLRWRWFPWNEYLYTNLRLGLIGASWVSDVSPWERQNSGNRKGSRYLNFLVPELTFSSGPDAPWEAFVRVHHRSGGWGAVNDVHGGSNYVAVGYRHRL